MNKEGKREEMKIFAKNLYKPQTTNPNFGKRKGGLNLARPIPKVIPWMSGFAIWKWRDDRRWETRSWNVASFAKQLS